MNSPCLPLIRSRFVDARAFRSLVAACALVGICMSCGPNENTEGEQLVRRCAEGDGDACTDAMNATDDELDKLDAAGTALENAVERLRNAHEQRGADRRAFSTAREVEELRSSVEGLAALGYEPRTFGKPIMIHGFRVRACRVWRVWALCPG
jgi:hypothetical protein